MNIEEMIAAAMAVVLLFMLFYFIYDIERMELDCKSYEDNLKEYSRKKKKTLFCGYELF